MRRNALILTVCAALMTVFAGSASAAMVSGAITDPANKTASPAQDIRGASIGYDQAGRVRGVLETRAPAYDPAVSGFRFLLGKASAKRGVCDGTADLTIYPPKPGETPLGSAFAGPQEVGDVGVVQSGNLIVADTLTGEAGGPIAALAGRPFNCGVVISFGPRERKGEYVDNDETKVFPLTAAQGPPVSCSIASRTKRKRLRATCANVAGPVTVRIYRKNKVYRKRKATVGAGGAVSVSARGLRRKREYRVALWQGSLMLGVDYIRIR